MEHANQFLGTERIGTLMKRYAIPCIISLLAIWYLLHMKIIRPEKGDYRLRAPVCGKTLALGMTSFLSQISLVASMMAVNNMIRKYSALDPVFGQEQYAQIPMAVVGIVMKFFQIVISIVVGMAAGCIPVAGFNMGAEKYDRVRELFTKLLLAEATVGAVALLLVEFFPRQIIGIFGAANESGFSESYIRDAGEYAPGGYLSLLSNRAFALTNEDVLWELQYKVITDLAEKGPCVIVGRCADYILRDTADCLKVFIHADMDFRAKRIVEVYGEREQSPEQRLRDKDKRRAAYHRFYTNMKWGHAQNYHICLDSGKLGIDACVAILKQLY